MNTEYSKPDATLPSRLTFLIKSLFQVLFNIIVIYLIFFSGNRVFFGYPLFAEGLIQAGASQFNRWIMLSRKKAADAATSQDLTKRKAECIASVVGYREDADVFKKCLESYASNYDQRHAAICVGIDGNEAEDYKMCIVAEEQVFGPRLATIYLEESFGHIFRIMQEAAMISEKTPTSSDINDHIMSTLISKATNILQAHDALYCSSQEPQPICIVQPHHSKKEIMFTTFIFNIALARANNVDFVWSSDSDSWVYPRTIEMTIDCMSTDEKLAGSCCLMEIHNAHLSMIATAVAATYEADMANTGGLLSSCDSTDCQPGPCAAFRAEALQKVLIPWFDQTVLGMRPLVNDDRHLTTRLLLAGYKVNFNPTVSVATDTPPTLPKWIIQQVRWSRATAVESLCYPKVYLQRHPILGIFSFRRIALPIINFAVVARYLTTGVGGSFSSIQDIALRMLVVGLYASFTNWRGVKGFVLHTLSPLVMQVPQTAFLFWATVTMFDNHWGTPMRSSNEQGKGSKRSFLSQNFGSLFVTTVWVSMVVGAFCRWVATTWALVVPMYAAAGGFVGAAGLFGFAIAAGM
ncbi:hypothetical protein BS50DRAFT_668049 [Corynespora cassiicola Philippines]|uniref:Glycosyltransferase 2-like domain-containing protein n=1 Tax=Corynespora cassiicola Philippines TaxID=1448308 RepID=A0A2T2NR22_CORCC|nr:hypothetical protein BS50DRAFT_668049 [Corynespora cassiicola Philippines]